MLPSPSPVDAPEETSSTGGMSIVERNSHEGETTRNSTVTELQLRQTLLPAR